MKELVETGWDDDGDKLPGSGSDKLPGSGSDKLPGSGKLKIEHVRMQRNEISAPIQANYN